MRAWQLGLQCLDTRPENSSFLIIAVFEYRNSKGRCPWRGGHSCLFRTPIRGWSDLHLQRRLTWAKAASLEPDAVSCFVGLFDFTFGENEIY